MLHCPHIIHKKIRKTHHQYEHRIYVLYIYNSCFVLSVVNDRNVSLCK